MRVQGNLRNALTDSVLVDYSLAAIPPPPTPHEVLFKHRYTPMAGGYVRWDEDQQMTVSSTPAGGPSENFRIAVDLPRAGEYFVDVMWTAAVPTQVYVYSDAKDLPHCSEQMTKAKIPDGGGSGILPEVTGGWGKGSLPKIPQRLGHLLLPKGSSTLSFISLSYGGGLGGGRAPSTAWVELTEIK